MNQVKELITPRLRLISLEDKHLDDLFSIYSDEETMRYWDDFPHKDHTKTKELLELLQNRINNQTGISWGIILNKKSNNIIGTISYNRYSKNGLATIGYILSRNFWNKGLMSEALAEFIEYGFSNLGIHRIEAHVEPGNVASEMLLLKVGFKKEGLLRERHFYKGSYQNLIIYGLLRTDDRKTKHNTT